MIHSLIKRSWEQRRLLFLFIFAVLLPVQKRFLLFNSEYFDFFHEYTSGFIYATDLLIGIGLYLAIEKLMINPVLRTHLRTPILVTVFLAAFLLIHFVLTSGALHGLYFSLRTLSIAVAVLIMTILLNRRSLIILLSGLAVGAGLQALIAIIQFAIQSDLGLVFLHESPLGVGIDGVAKVYGQNSEKYIRGYGLFPHPNILGTYLLGGLVSALVLMKREWSRRWQRIVYIGLGMVIVAGLVVSFSRVAWLGFVLVVMGGAFYWMQFEKHRQYLKKIVVIGLVGGVLSLILLQSTPVMERVNFSHYAEGDSLRQFYNSHTWNAIENSFVLGLGPGNNVPGSLGGLQLVQWGYQPAHNIFLILLSEYGIASLSLVILIVGSIRVYWDLYRSLRLYIVLGTLYIVVLFSLDHYLLTLQQGRLVLALVSAVLFSVTQATLQSGKNKV